MHVNMLDNVRKKKRGVMTSAITNNTYAVDIKQNVIDTCKNSRCEIFRESSLEELNYIGA